MHQNSHRWPDGARMAATISVLLEVWSDDKWPSYFPRTTALKPGMQDISARRWASFGMKEGVYRLLAALSRHKLQATVFVNAIVAEREPELLQHIVEEGHSVAAHGYSQDQFLMEMSRDEQRATIKRCAELIAAATGRRPRGWVTSVYSWTEATHELLAQEGFTWHADALDSSFPYRQDFEGSHIIALPWCDFVDNRVLRASPKDYSDAYEGLLEYTRAHEPLGLVNIGMHCHFGGRPLMGASIEKVFRSVASASDVWKTTHDGVATWFADRGVKRLNASAMFGARS